MKEKISKYFSETMNINKNTYEFVMNLKTNTSFAKYNSIMWKRLRKMHKKSRR